MTKFLNVNSCGKPALVFKQIKDIYVSEDAKTNSVSMLKPTAENDGIRVKIDRTCLPITKREPIGSDSETFGSDSETYGSDSHGSCEEGNSDLDDDFSFSSMTLKQLKERCKTKKRKLSKFVDLTKEDIETCSPVKQEYSDSLLEDDEFDLKEPLISWKARLTKNSKAKKRCTSEHISTSSQSAVSLVKSKLTLSDQGFQQSTRDLPTPVKVKVEVPEPDYSDSQGVADVCSMVQVEVGGPDYSGCQNVTCVAEDEVPASDYSDSQGDANNCSMGCNEQVKVPVLDYSSTQSVTCNADDSSDCNEQVGSCEVVSSKMLENDSESVLETRHSITFTERPQECDVNEISYEYIENAQPNSLPNVGPTIAETLEVDNPESNNQASVLSVSEFKNEDFITYPLPQGIPPLTISPTKKHNFASASPASEIKDEGYTIQLLTQDISPQVLSPTKEHNSASFLPGSEFRNEEYVHLLAQGISPQTLSPQDISPEHSSDICNSSESYSLNSSNGVQVPDTITAIDNSLHCMEPSYGGVASVFEDDHTGDLPSTLQASSATIPGGKCSSSWNSNLCHGPTSCLVPEGDDLPATEVKQLLMFAGSDAAGNCSWSHSCDTTDEELTSVVMENYQHSELQHGPERLFSTRKAISPTSQERLCRAMNSIDLCDNLEPYECKIKLRFAKRTEGRTSSAEPDFVGDEVDIGPGGPEQSSRNEVTVISKQSIRRRKNDMKGSHPKGILKVPQLSRGLPHLSNTCTSSQSYSQSAIAFSQRQMHDIECLAAKLTRELKSMKDIVEETMHSEVCPSSSRYGTDEVRTAIENANKVEETTKRWLSMMARDCNRFCKIMRLTENESVASGNTIHKERKKITFADEAGGELCHVKLFYDGMASPLEPNGEKQELMAK